MESNLYSISPIDGRYRNQTGILASYFSEAALIRYRVMVEIEYFIALCKVGIPQLSGFKHEDFEILRNVFYRFTTEDALRVKEIEQITNHDVKAVEYFLKEIFDKNGWQDYREFIHFGLTSQDLNNTAQPYAVKTAHELVLQPLLHDVYKAVLKKAEEYNDIPMLARTHGQPASPTRLGKEFMVFAERIKNQLEMLEKIPFTAKFGGATGNFNAHFAAYPEIDWKEFANSFISGSFGLQRQQTTTQIEHYDYLAAYFDNLKRINTILIDICRDIWTYVSMDYFSQKIKANEVGSSAMPHKVNPIDFENAEGNLGIANALFDFFSAKLPISRLQRDLTDSTVMRNIGVSIAHTVIALRSILRGLDKLMLNDEAISSDLENNWAVIAEGIQSILRRENFPNPYEALKELTRTNEVINKETLHRFIEALAVTEKVKSELKSLTPLNYLGI